MQDSLGSEMSELMSMMKTFIKSSDDRAKIHDSQYDAQQCFNKKTAERIDEISAALQTYISSSEKNQRNGNVLFDQPRHCSFDTSRLNHSGNNLTGVLLSSLLEQNEKHTSTLQEEIRRLQKIELYEAIKKIS